MLRRYAMKTMAGAALPLAFAARQNVAAAATAGAYYPTYTVLQLGTVAKATSQIVLSRSKNPATRTFAQLEIIEQTAAAQALTSNYAPPPPTLDATQQAIVAKVQDASAATIDYIYVGVQIMGHQALLKIQQQLLASDYARPDFDIVHIALLLQSNVQQHLILLMQILAEVSA